MQASDVINLLQRLMAALDDGDVAHAKVFVRKITDQIRVDTVDDAPKYDAARKSDAANP